MSEHIKRVLILNRGEIASRAILACRRIGLTSVLFSTPVDEQTLAFSEADEVYQTKASDPGGSYLNLDEIRTAILKTKVDYVYPGYGFLSEKAELAKLCEDLRVGFIGPTAEVLERLASKTGARDLARVCGLRTLEITNPDPDDYPLLLKADRGGGGRGHAIVEDPAQLESMVESLRRRSGQLFKNTDVLMERYLPQARHVELQVFVDPQGTRFLGTRDCSFQRNFQKLIEEGPAEQTAVDLIVLSLPAIASYLEGNGYRGPATLEFLFDPHNRGLFFLEINCRIQVEHTVTEELLGTDLVESQISCFTDPNFVLSQRSSNGHSLELRLYAEDVERGFLPSTGTISLLHLPHLPLTRFDMSYGPGHEVSPHYDPLLGKIIVRGHDRQDCIRRGIQVLEQVVVLGVKTNLQLLVQALADETFQSMRHHITWLPELPESSASGRFADLDPLAHLSGGREEKRKELSWKNFHRK